MQVLLEFRNGINNNNYNTAGKNMIKFINNYPDFFHGLRYSTQIINCDYSYILINDYHEEKEEEIRKILAIFENTPCNYYYVDFNEDDKKVKILVDPNLPFKGVLENVLHNDQQLQELDEIDVDFLNNNSLHVDVLDDNKY